MIDPRELLEEYVDGLLDSESQRVVEDALAQDEELRAELERVRRFSAMLRELPTPIVAERSGSIVRHRRNVFFPLFAAVAAVG